MSTYRCGSCRAIYADPPLGGGSVHHTCALVWDTARRRYVARPAHRDENIVQDTPGGPVRIRAVGMGRVLLAEDDIVTGATPKEVALLHWQDPLSPGPVPEYQWRPDPRQGFPAPAE